MCAELSLNLVFPHGELQSISRDFFLYIPLAHRKSWKIFSHVFPLIAVLVLASVRLLSFRAVLQLELMLSKATDAVKFVILVRRKTSEVLRVCHRAAFLFPAGPHLLLEQ